MNKSHRALLFATLIGIAVAAQAGPPASHASFSPEAIASINRQMHALVDQRHAAGIVTLIAQHGRTIDLDAYGDADAELHTPMRPDAVMAIASMTKPVTGVAMMMLYEQGKWALDDPVAKFVPQFKDLKVMEADGRLVPPQHAPTMRELMSHTAGFTYGVFGASTVDKLYLKENILDPNSSLAVLIDKLSHLPLKHQPGTHWEYSVSVDVQGYIVQQLAGVPYDAYVREHILKPLKMKDTDFAVSGAARARLAYMHTSKDGALVVALPPGGRTEVAKTTPGLPSPGGALYSSAPDYARFCQMLLNGGTLDGVRLLKAQSVRMMHENMLPPGVAADILGKLPGMRFGMDFALAPDPTASHEPLPEGSYYWLGIFGTYFWIDPRDDLLVVGMLQRAWSPSGGDPTYDPFFARSEAVKIVYGALH